MEARKLRQWENLMTEYGIWQAYYRGRRRTCPGYYPVTLRRLEVRTVTMQEVIERAKQLYPELKLKPASARSWTLNELIPAPTIESLGRGRGVRAHYPVDSAAQMATAAYLQRDLGYTQKEIAQARAFVLGDATIDTPNMQQVCDLIAMTLKPEAVSKETRRIFNCVGEYARSIALARAGENLASLWGGITFQAHGHDEQGRPTLHYSVSLPGLYWDPRLTGGDPEKEA